MPTIGYKTTPALLTVSSSQTETTNANGRSPPSLMCSTQHYSSASSLSKHATARFPGSFRNIPYGQTIVIGRPARLDRAVHVFQTQTALRTRRSSFARVYCDSALGDRSPEACRAFRQREIARLEPLNELVLAADSLSAKHRCLDQEVRVTEFLSTLRGNSLAAWEQLSEWDQYLLKCLAAAGQGHLLQMPDNMASSKAVQGLKKLVQLAEHLETFYDVFGGAIGYQVAALRLIDTTELARERAAADVAAGITSASTNKSDDSVKFHIPVGPNLAEDPELARDATTWGLEGLPYMCEMYPVGGAGDRLGLVDEATGESLPAALLPYCGRSMLEGLIRDLHAREFLFYRLHGVQHTTPVAIMTSAAKKNNERVLRLCEAHQWFGRSREMFRVIEQSQVPVVTAAHGTWQRTGVLEPMLKPGGHGVLWKLARDNGVFDWFHQHGRTAALVRQISNPLAGTNQTLLALSGMGRRNQKAMGFASCERRTGAAEGMVVLVEKKVKGDGEGIPDEYRYGVSNVEYTEFERLGLADSSQASGSAYSKYPANTNVLYVNLNAIDQAMNKDGGRAALPGMLVNLTKPVLPDGERGGRLECSMQSIAEFLTDSSLSQKDPDQWYNDLGTYVTFNQRCRVTSSAKKKLQPGSSNIAQTPHGSFRTLQTNAGDLLRMCGMQVPEFRSPQEYLAQGPDYLVWMHPAMGPLWDVIAQKIQGGCLGHRSELGLECAEVALEEVELEGSLLIEADHVMGPVEASEGGEPMLRFSDYCGRCRLSGVRIVNEGVDWECADNVYWKNQIQRKESCRVLLHGNAEFEASNVIIQGAHTFEVAEGHVMRVMQGPDGSLVSEVRPLADGRPTWTWSYDLQGNEVVLEMTELDPLPDHATAAGPNDHQGAGQKEGTMRGMGTQARMLWANMRRRQRRRRELAM